MTTTEKLDLTIPMVSILLGATCAPIGIWLNLSPAPFLLAIVFGSIWMYGFILYALWKW